MAALDSPSFNKPQGNVSSLAIHGSFMRKGAYYLFAPSLGPLGWFGGRSSARQFAAYVNVVLKGRAAVDFVCFVLFCFMLT